MTFSSQEELDIFLMDGGRVQFLTWKKSSPTFMHQDLNGQLWYGDDESADRQYKKPVALDYRQVRRFVPTAKACKVKPPFLASLSYPCKWLVVVAVGDVALHIIRAVGGF